MKKSLLIGISLLFLISCVKENRPSYKKNDLFGEFDTQQGFVIMHLPPILFKVVLNANKEEKSDQKDLFEKIEIIKVLFFEENEKSIKTQVVKNNLLGKIYGVNYNLLTQIIDTDTTINIYCKDDNSIIKELIFLMVSEKEVVCINCVGNFDKEDALKIYKSIDAQAIKINVN
ncbi:MAG: DUF4252 domain-containing protein [Bacteroidales bacterium]